MLLIFGGWIHHFPNVLGKPCLQKQNHVCCIMSHSQEPHNCTKEIHFQAKWRPKKRRYRQQSFGWTLPGSSRQNPPVRTGQQKINQGQSSQNGNSHHNGATLEQNDFSGQENQSSCDSPFLLLGYWRYDGFLNSESGLCSYWVAFLSSLLSYVLASINSY